ncbi:MAG: glycosyl hydrolase 53 family protein [Candidatus Eisenbacteria bacterium]
MFARLALILALTWGSAGAAQAQSLPGANGIARAIAAGGDVSYLPQLEAAGATFRDSLGPADALTVLQRHGMDWVRVRLWHSPADGRSGLAEVTALALRAKAQGLRVLLDLHYSDTWADPTHQGKPAAWNTLSANVLQDSVRRYAREVIATLVARGARPDMVQIGNEITVGMLWDTGRVEGSFDTPAQWTRFTAMLSAAAVGVSEGSPTVKVPVMLHTDRGGDATGAQKFYDHMVEAGVPFDVIGVSYYPWWHGSLGQFEATLTLLANRYQRDVVVAETAYPWTLAALDGTTNTVGSPSQLLAGYPATPLGQAQFVERVTQIVRRLPQGRGRGVFYWAPDWISAPGLGSAAENLALFDAAGMALPAADALASRDPLDDIFYQFMPIAWRDSDNDANRFGDFGGMKASLEYLRYLGVSAVWMTPIFDSPAYHGYQHMPANLLNPRFGTEPQFVDFVRQAHRDSVKVFIDFVAYHVSQGSTYFQTSYGNPASPYTNYLAYTNAGNTTYDGGTFTTWNGASVGQIKWRLTNPTVTGLITGWTQHWLDPDGNGDPSDGVDGYRLDHVLADEGYGYTMGWWNSWKSALQSVQANVFTFAEQADWGSHGSELLTAHDAAFTKPFEFAARSALASQSAASLYSEMRSTLASLPAGRTYLATLGDHDVDRLASATGDVPGRNRVAAAVLMTQPFPPVIYYGDELGMKGVKANYGSDANDIPFREPFKWKAVAGAPMSNYWTLNAQAYTNRYARDNDGRSVEEQAGISGSLLETYRGLIRARREHVALRRGVYAEVANSSGAVWAFARHAAGQESLLVAINLSATAVSTVLDLSGFGIANGSSPVRDVVTGAPYPALTTANKAAYSLSLPAYSWVILNAALTLPPPAAPSTRDGRNIPTDFGAAQLVATQDNVTGLGDNINELDQLHVRPGVSGIEVGITGNVATDGTAWVLLLDTKSGGQDTLHTSSFGAPPSGLAQLDGLIMDSGFTPDVLLWLNGYGGNLYVDHVALASAGGGTKRYVGSTAMNTGLPDLSGGNNTYGMQAAFNDSNSAGVTGSSVTGAATATQGLEAMLPWGDLFLAGPGADVRMMAMIVQPDGRIGNQFLPGLGGGRANLGYAPKSLRTVPGAQYATISTATLDASHLTMAVHLAAWPNPHRDAVQIRFVLPRAQRVIAEVLDLAGRRVRDMGAHPMGAGAQRLEWDGREDSGRSAGPGLYFVRITSADRVQVARVVRVK